MSGLIVDDGPSPAPSGVAGISPRGPLPVSTESLSSQLSGTQTALEAVASAAYPAESSVSDAVAKLLSRAIRAAQSRMEDLSETPFFVTRYCTPELARSGDLQLGVDYDAISQPRNYIRERWIRQSGRINLPKHPVLSIEQYKLSLGQDAVVYDIDLNWVQIDQKHASIYVLPSGLATAGLSFQNLYGYGVWVRGSATGQVPLLIHLRYTAGLVQRTGTADDPGNTDLPYDPDADQKNTIWDQALVDEYQERLLLFAAALLMKPIGQYIERGGVSISLDGLSQTVNPQLLQQRAESYVKVAEDWARSSAQSSAGVPMVML